MALIQSLEELQAIRDAQNGGTASRGMAAVSGTSRSDSPVYGTYTAETAASFAETLRQKAEEPAKAVKYDDIFSLASRTYGISKNLLLAVAETESNFDATAVSRAGAQGVMQLMPSTARYLGVDNAFDPYQNIMGGAKLLRDNIRQFGSVPLALAAYNAGPDAVQKYGGVPPYTETQNYVKKIMGMLGNGAYKANNSYIYSGSAEGGSASGGVYLDTTGSSRTGASSRGTSDSGEMVHLLLSDYNSLLSSLLLSSVGSSLSTGLLGNGLSGLSGTSSLLGGSLSGSLLGGLSANNYNTYNLYNSLGAGAYANLRSISNAVGTLPDAEAGAEEGDAAGLSGETAAAGSAATAAASSQNTASPMLTEGTVTMSKENFQNLVELLRLQMLMGSSSTLGIV